MPNQKTTTSEFYCTKCGRRGIPIARKVGKQREAGHLKKLYCPFCREEVNHAEIRPFGEYNYEDFKLEFDLGRFVNGNKIPTTYSSVFRAIIIYPHFLKLSSSTMQ